MEPAENSGLFDLTGQVALVTGAAGGLGQAIALTLAELGAAVVLSDREQSPIDALCQQMTDAGHRALAVAADLANEDAVTQLAQTAERWHDGVDTLVCCGGMEGHVGSLLDASDADWQKLMTVNLQSAQWLCRVVAPGMVRREHGSITFIASIAGLRGNGKIGLYGLAKAALSQLARNLAVELGPHGVRVNAVAPGLIKTPLSEHLMGDAAFMQRRLGITPLRRVGQPEEISGVVAMLAARAGGFITGQTLVVDGGTLITDGS